MSVLCIAWQIFDLIFLKLIVWSMQKILIITYYWPPSGGAGVQRWVKLVKYLSVQNIEIHVLTVDQQYASYSMTDHSIISDIPDNIHIHKTKSFEPINIYGKIVGKNKIPIAGFSNVDNFSLKQKTVNFLRSNLFIPDPRKFWNYFAIKKAKELILKNGIEVVITSSPPHSTQLIGRKLKKLLKVKWIADLRDPWTDIYYYPLLYHSKLSKKIDRYYEKKTLESSDAIITVSESLKELFLQKLQDLPKDKFTIIPNGFDEADFEPAKIIKDFDKFVINYTGSMSLEYHPESFLSVLNGLVETGLFNDFQMNFIGNIHQNIKDSIIQSKLNEYTSFIPGVPHNEIIHYQLNCHVLLLIIPETKHAEGILTGKLFEYLASGNKIICIGPKHGDAAKIISSCNAGCTLERNEKGKMKEFLCSQYQIYKKNQWVRQVNPEVFKYSRKNQADQLMKLLQNIH